MTNQEQYRIVTAPVLIPGTPDCDYHRGEQPLTTEEIKQLMTSFKKYNIIDYNHEYMFDGPWYLKKIGEPLDMWQTTKETTYTDRFDVERTTPPGTWYLKTKVTDPEVIKQIDDEKINSYSLTTASKTLADKFMELTNEVNAKSVTYTSKEVTELLKKHGMISNKHRTLLHDVPNPVGFTVSLTDFPCVGGSVFAKNCLITSQNQDKEKISNKNGSEKMTETPETTTRFSVDDVKNLFSFFTSMKSEEPKKEPEEKPEEKPGKPEEKEEYITRDELNQAFEENNKKIVSEISTIIDEKLKEKEEKKEEETKKEEEETKKEEEKETKKEEEKISTKSQSKQIDDPDPQEEKISYKKGTPEYQILKSLGRDALGNTTIKL